MPVSGSLHFKGFRPLNEQSLTIAVVTFYHHLRKMRFVFTLHVTYHLFRYMDGFRCNRKRKYEFSARIGCVAWYFCTDAFGFIRN